MFCNSFLDLFLENLLSMGYGFVEYKNRSDALQAIKQLQVSGNLCLVINNRPFYRYGGHIELIRFKEYYRMPRGHEHISLVFSSTFRDKFS